MKTITKHFHFPDMHLHIHINPIYRDVATILALGFLIAIAALTLVVMFVSQM